MTAQAQQQEQPAVQPKPQPRSHWEFLWRFIAVAMLFEVGWVVWIAIQINPPPFILPAAYEAAEKALASHNAEGRIGGAARSFEAASSPSALVPALNPAAPGVAAAPASALLDPPVNLEKLKFSDTIETPIPEQPAKSATRREQ